MPQQQVRDAKPTRLLKQGGTRRVRYAPSNQLTQKQCERLIHAAYHAWDIGQPFNRFITLLWEKGGIDGRCNAETTGHFIKLASDWARRHGYRLAWAWVQEYGSINKAHVHILLHVPPELDGLFKHMPKRWAKTCLPMEYVTGTVDSKRPARSERIEAHAITYECWLMGKVHYMLKYAPAPLERKLVMARWRTPWSKSWGKQGVTYCKRLGIWQHRRND